MLCDRVEQRAGLEPVARRVAGLFGDPAGIDGFLNRRNDQARPDLLDAPVPEFEHLGKVVARVDVHDGKRQPRRPECLFGQAEHDDRVLATGEQQHRTLELGSHLPDDVDGLRLDRLKLRQLVVPGRSGPPRLHDGPV